MGMSCTYRLFFLWNYFSIQYMPNAIWLQGYTIMYSDFMTHNGSKSHNEYNSDI